MGVAVVECKRDNENRAVKLEGGPGLVVIYKSRQKGVVVFVAVLDQRVIWSPK